MIRITDSHAVVSDEVMYVEYAGKSTDTKPTIFGQTITVVNGAQVLKDIAIATGSVFLEVNTGDVYLYSEADEAWVKVGG